jgi:hypothetical protein
MYIFRVVALLLTLGPCASISRNPFLPMSANDPKTEYVSRLLRQATPTANSQLHRQLNNNNNNQVPNIATYAIKFQQCQFVKTYNDDLADDEDSETVLAIKRFIIFRLCPDDDCSTCSSGFGEYMVDLEAYLTYTTAYYQMYEEAMCEVCDNTCYAEENADGENADANAEEQAADGGERRRLKNDFYFSGEVDCSVCVTECANMANAEALNYIDATNFLECQLIYNSGGDDDVSLYAGPFCTSNGAKINIGVFSDENCNNLDSSKKVDDYMMLNGAQASLNHATLKKTYTNTCISCLEPKQEQNNNNGNDADDADAVIEVCEQIYKSSAKCEKPNGFDDGSDYVYTIQENTEETVCDYISSLKHGTYDESGDIVIGSISQSLGRGTTGGQKFALAVFVLGTFGLAVYAAMLHARLVRTSTGSVKATKGTML